MRKLATIQQIADIQPIDGADKIEKVQVRDWWCVAKKGEFTVGETCVFFEIDSLLPSSNSVFDFLADRSRVVTVLLENGDTASGYRLRTVKMRGQISQGLAIRPEAFAYGFTAQPVGTDVSAAIGVHLWEPPISKMLASMARGPFPWFIPKTDEERVQNMRAELSARVGESVYITEKLDGTSATFYRDETGFHACSRNLDTKEGSLYWQIAEKYGLIESLPIDFAIQGEIIGEGIQGNPLKRKGQEFYAFNVYLFGVNAAIGDYEFMIKGDIPFPHFVAFCAQVGVPMVPLLCADATLTDRVAEFLAMADGQSLLSPGCVREGLVFKTRMATNRLSFKAISNQYLLKGDR